MAKRKEQYLKQMLAFIKRIMQRMLEVYKRLWHVFISLCFTLAGLALGVEFYRLPPISGLILILASLVCGVVGMIGLRQAIKAAQKRDWDEKHPPKSPKFIGTIKNPPFPLPW